MESLSDRPEWGRLGADRLGVRGMTRRKVINRQKPLEW